MPIRKPPPAVSDDEPTKKDAAKINVETSFLQLGLYLF
jgi:hypothetical protein